MTALACLFFFAVGFSNGAIVMWIIMTGKDGDGPAA